jgi:hypothetical protein
MERYVDLWTFFQILLIIVIHGFMSWAQMMKNTDVTSKRAKASGKLDKSNMGVAS